MSKAFVRLKNYYDKLAKKSFLFPSNKVALYDNNDLKISTTKPMTKEINFTESDFRGKNCTRLKQLNYLIANNLIDSDLRGVQ